MHSGSREPGFSLSEKGVTNMVRGKARMNTVEMEWNERYQDQLLVCIQRYRNRYIHVCLPVWVCMWKYAYDVFMFSYEHMTHIYMYICLHVCTCVLLCPCLYTYTRVYVCVLYMKRAPNKNTYISQASLLKKPRSNEIPVAMSTSTPKCWFLNTILH